MPNVSLDTILQVIVGLGLLNVWLLRSRAATSYRGGEARTLKQEFEAYGLPPIAFYLVGVLKVGAALALIAGLWMPTLVFPAASLVAALMVGALSMHLKVGDPPAKSLPAFLMLIMSVAVCWLNRP